MSSVVFFTRTENLTTAQVLDGRKILLQIDIFFRVVIKFLKELSPSRRNSWNEFLIFLGKKKKALLNGKSNISLIKVWYNSKVWYVITRQLFYISFINWHLRSHVYIASCKSTQRCIESCVVARKFTIIKADVEGCLLHQYVKLKDSTSPRWPPQIPISLAVSGILNIVLFLHFETPLISAIERVTQRIYRELKQ